MIKLFKVVKVVIVLSVLILLNSCSSSLPPKEYVNWIDNSENGLIKEQLTNSKKITCKYTPAEYVVLKQFSPDHIDEGVFNTEVEGLKDMYHFILKFEKLNGTNMLKDNYTTQEEFQTRSMYLSYDIKSDLKLITGLDTVSCILNHHERTYSNTPYEIILLSFPKQNNTIEEMTLIFDDRVFGFNRVKFFFSKNELNSIPKLEIK